MGAVLPTERVRVEVAFPVSSDTEFGFSSGFIPVTV